MAEARVIPRSAGLAGMLRSLMKRRVNGRRTTVPFHMHCSHWPECCCWCGLGLTEEEAGWQDALANHVSRDIVVMAQYRLEGDENA